MEYEELTDREKEVWDEAHELAWEAGWDEGYDAAISNGSDEYDDGYHAGHIAGQEAEQARIQSVLGMMFESALNMGQGNKAVQYKHAMDLLKPININQSYSDDD